MPRPEPRRKIPKKRKKLSTKKVKVRILKNRLTRARRGQVIVVTPKKRPSKLRGRIIAPSSGEVHKEFAEHQAGRVKGFSGRITVEKVNTQLKNHVRKGKTAGKKYGAGNILINRPKESNKRRKKKR